MQNLSGGFGTGEVVGSGVVLTAGHVVNDQFATFPNRFVLDGETYIGLPIPDPNYSPGLGYGSSDIGLLVLANFDDIDSMPANTLATAAQENSIIATINGGKAVNATIVGMTSADGVLAGSPQQGTTQIKFAPGNYDGTLMGIGKAGSDTNNWTFDPTLKADATTGYTGSNWVDHGDSGGPTFATVDGKSVIIGVHSFRAPETLPFDPTIATVDVDTRISPYLNFINGNGDNGSGGAGASNLVYLNSTTNGTWDDATNWKGGVIPGNNSIAILDPTNDESDTGTQITITNADTATLNGLLNDTSLIVTNGRTLSVQGTAGITNTGIISVKGSASAAATPTYFSMYYQLDNEGTINLSGQTTAWVGLNIPGTTTNVSQQLVPTQCLLNDTKSTINIQAGAYMTCYSSVENYGAININNNGTAGATSTMYFANRLAPGAKNGPPPAGTTQITGFDNGNPMATTSTAKMNVGPGGTLYDNSPIALFNNMDGSTLTIQGDATGPATATLYQILNAGTLTVGVNATLNPGFNLADSAINLLQVTNPGGTISVTGGPAGTAAATVGMFSSTLGGTVSVTNGTIQATQFTNIGTVNVGSGGTFNVDTPTAGSEDPAVVNNLQINITAGAMPAVMEVSGQAFNNQTGSKIVLSSMTTSAQLLLNNSTLTNDGLITGGGTVGGSTGGGATGGAIVNNADGVITAGDGVRLALAGGTPLVNHGIINVGAIVSGTGSEISITGGGTGSTFTNQGTINMPGGGFLDSGPAASNPNYMLANAGTIAGRGFIQFSGGVTNTGTINQTGGSLTIQSLTSNTGTINLNGSGNLSSVNAYYYLQVTNGGTSNITFTNSGTINIAGSNGSLFGTQNASVAFTNARTGVITATGGLHDINFGGTFTNLGSITATGPVPAGLPAGGNYNLQLNNLGGHGGFVNGTPGVMLATAGARFSISPGTVNRGVIKLTLGSTIINLPVGNPIVPAAVPADPMPNLTNEGTVTVDSTSTLNAGSYEQDGSAAATLIDGMMDSSVDLTGGTLAGSGHVLGSVTDSGGDLIPGDSLSPDLTIDGGVDIDPAGELSIGLFSTTAYDQLDFGEGGVTLGGTLILDLGPAYLPTVGDRFPVIVADGDNSIPVTGAFDSVEATQVYPDGEFVAVYQPADNPDGVDVTFVAVPEPAGVLVLITGAVLFHRRRR